MRTLYNYIRTGTVAAMALMLTLGCSDSLNDAEALESAKQYMHDGTSGYFYLENSQGQAWTISDCPAWITPCATQGTAADAIKLYIESNTRTPLRRGDIVVRYANGVSTTTRAEQDNTQTSRDLRRSYSVGWGFDVRTYNDSRGLRDQIFSLEKLDEKHPGMYHNESSTSINASFYYGDDASDLQSDINAKMQLDGKFGMFSLDLKANFGMSSVSNSKRIFSWLRDYTAERLVYLDNPDYFTMLTTMPFTHDFITARDNVIKYAHTEQADEYIRQLIDYYGTHFIARASLGGCIDYYYSSVFNNSEGTLDVEAALKMEYANKFKLEGDAKYKDEMKAMDNETIEKVVVKGGDAIDYTSAIMNGDAKDPALKCTDKWKASLSDDRKWELIQFELTPISELFSDGYYFENGELVYDESKDVKTIVDAYLDRLYYIDLPLTRADKNANR